MSNMRAVLFALLFAATHVSALPHILSKLFSRDTIAHDQVEGFPESVPSGITGTLMLKYQPYLEVYNGCVPFPAVNEAGDTSGGLEPTGDPNGDCSSSLGQVYARAAEYNGAYAIMYSWYMPKDSPASGLGHRHDWENVVVWLSEQSEAATLRGVAISAHGDYDKQDDPPLSGSRPTIGYISIFPVNHQLIATPEQGGQQPLVAWESMTEEARGAIESTDFGSATPSFRDGNFESYLEDAFI